MLRLIPVLYTGHPRSKVSPSQSYPSPDFEHQPSDLGIHTLTDQVEGQWNLMGVTEMELHIHPHPAIFESSHYSY